jgi:integrase
MIYGTTCRPKARNTRGYTRQEIAKMAHGADERLQALIFTLASTGMRIEGAAQLRMKHLHKITEYGLYRITVYELDPHEYICFTTPEAAKAIDAYVDFREKQGEKVRISPEAPLFREDFYISDIDPDDLRARHPTSMRSEALGDLLRYRIQRVGIVERTPRQENQRRGRKRNLIPRSHGFRRFAITAMINKRINETIRNLLTDHNVKLDKNYYYPTEEEKLAEYLKVVDCDISYRAIECVCATRLLS